MVTINRDLNSQARSVEALFGVDADTVAQVKAEYLYSAYGEVMMKSGDLADKNNITYRTRYKEANTGLVSYTHRHYSPRLKKWLSKDPISESGGINLYQMVGNDPVGYLDMLGYAYQACHIYIFFGHTYATNDSQLDMSMGIGKAIKSVNNALENKSFDPKATKFGVVSCCSTITNNILDNMGCGFIDQKNTSKNVENLYEETNPNRFNNPKSLNSQLKNAIKDAEVKANKMCKDKKLCCPNITIKVELVMDTTEMAYKSFKGVYDALKPNPKIKNCSTSSSE